MNEIIYLITLYEIMIVKLLKVISYMIWLLGDYHTAPNSASVSDATIFSSRNLNCIQRSLTNTACPCGLQSNIQAPHTAALSNAVR